MIQEATSTTDSLQVATDTVRQAAEFMGQVGDSVVVGTSLPDVIVNMPGDPILESLIGVLIAAFASFITYWLTRRQDSQRSKSTYIGVLKSVHAELRWIQNHAENLSRSVSEVKRISVEEGAFVVEETPEPVHLDWIESCRSKMLEYDRVNMMLLHALSHFTNLARDTNRTLNFRVAKSLVVDLDGETKRAALSDYFETLETQYLAKLKNASVWLADEIEKNLKELGDDTDLLPPPALRK